MLHLVKLIINFLFFLPLLISNLICEYFLKGISTSIILKSSKSNESSSKVKLYVDLSHLKSCI